MLNINELEEKWLRYKIKSYIPHAIIIISISIIIISLITLYNFKPLPKIAIQQNIPAIEQNTTIKEKINAPVIQSESIQIVKVEKPIEEPIKQFIPSINEVEQKNSKMTMNPSLDFMINMRTNIPQNYENTTSTEVTEDIIDEPAEENIQDLSDKKIDVEVQNENVEEESKKSSISISRQDAHDDIKYVIQRFKKNNNPALSLFIAKKYYELGEYHKSYNYSLMTNAINNDIEASWLIFARSLVKLNEKEMAIKTLTQYIEHSNSNRAKILLDEITTGKFK